MDERVVDVELAGEAAERPVAVIVEDEAGEDVEVLWAEHEPSVVACSATGDSALKGSKDVSDAGGTVSSCGGSKLGHGVHIANLTSRRPPPFPWSSKGNRTATGTRSDPSPPVASSAETSTAPSVSAKSSRTTSGVNRTATSSGSAERSASRVERTSPQGVQPRYA